MAEVVPAEFIYGNSEGGDNLYRAVRSFGGYTVTDHSGPKSGLNGSSITYSQEQVCSYLFGTKQWRIVEVIKENSFVSTLPVKTTFWTGIELRGKRYEANSVEEACKLLGQIRALLKMEESLARKCRS